jgi:response regulator RpfG family c-di-GMP phosphodiesterase
MDELDFTEKATILVVDDTPDNLDLSRRVYKVGLQPEISG